MKKAICPGSFDPVTLGHMDIFYRSAGLFDKLYIGVFNNIRKKPLLSVEERIELLRVSLKDIPNIEIVSFDGLLADYMVQKNISVIVRGLRSVTDYEYEYNQAQLIKKIHPELDTIFLLGKPEYACYSSSAVREILNFGGDIASFVPPAVKERLLGAIKK